MHARVYMCVMDVVIWPEFRLDLRQPFLRNYIYTHTIILYTPWPNSSFPWHLAAAVLHTYIYTYTCTVATHFMSHDEQTHYIYTHTIHHESWWPNTSSPWHLAAAVLREIAAARCRALLWVMRLIAVCAHWPDFMVILCTHIHVHTRKRTHAHMHIRIHTPNVCTMQAIKAKMVAVGRLFGPKQNLKVPQQESWTLNPLTPRTVSYRQWRIHNIVEHRLLPPEMNVTDMYTVWSRSLASKL